MNAYGTRRSMPPFFAETRFQIFTKAGWQYREKKQNHTTETMFSLPLLWHLFAEVLGFIFDRLMSVSRSRSWSFADLLCCWKNGFKTFFCSTRLYPAVRPRSYDCSLPVSITFIYRWVSVSLLFLKQIKALVLNI